MASEFPGFPEAGFRLLRRLKKNNDRDWFSERKSEYQERVERPMEALVLAVAAGCRDRQLPLYAKEKNAVMRVYRDVRFSKDKSPFKTHVAAELRRSFRDSAVMLYLHFSPEQSFVAAGVWQPDRALLHAWREAIAKEPQRFEEMAAELERKNMPLSREHSLSAMPRGFQNYSADSFSQWLKLTSFVASRKLERDACTRPGLAEGVVEFALAAKPLFQFGWQVEKERPKPTNTRLEQLTHGGRRQP
ncbi:MAG TPA: DUF2461 domain-containing protein [Bryobacteraceae bacterium]|nr:DUF2461 domain-containing protein [Bryobacteraceae bacterium]